ncbi:MAG: GEVED domain-containing protein [Segetibacter sp.]
MKKILLCLAAFFGIQSLHAQAPAYCEAGVTYADFEKISRVALGSINNASTSTAGYEDFTALSTTLAQGSANAMTVEVSHANYYTDQVLVWIDFNQDGDFTDAGEAVHTSALGQGLFYSTVAVPAGARIGATRMRVRLHNPLYDTPNSTPCGTSNGGQVEDYTVNIVDLYCAAGATSTNFEKISRVALGSIDNASASTAGYEDFTHLSTTLAQGSANAMTVEISNMHYYTDLVLVWIDFNQDGDFADDGEAVHTSALSIGLFYSTVAVPASATLGATRMRVRLHDSYYGTPNSTPCGMSTWGQVEDYTVNIICKTNTYYKDSDGDGFGHAASTISDCAATPPSGYVTDSTDCDDSKLLYADADGDGYGTGSPIACGAANNTDCDDNDNAKHASFSFYVDTDDDGHGSGNAEAVCAVDGNTPPAGYATDNTDCAPDDAAKWGSASLYTDRDADGYTTGNGTIICYGAAVPSGYSATRSTADDCDDNNANVWRSATLFLDNDGDGYDNGSVTVCYGQSMPANFSATTSGRDCDDTEASVHPGAAEVCNGIDDDCDGQTDEGLPQHTYYLDSDGDGYGSSNTTTTCSSAAPQGYAARGGDCNDANAAVNPGKAEICGNSIDDNCNGQVDENCGPCANATGFTTTNITTTSATFNWTASATLVQWQVQYKSTNQGSKWVDVAVASSSRSVTITGLKARSVLPMAHPGKMRQELDGIFRCGEL